MSNGTDRIPQHIEIKFLGMGPTYLWIEIDVLLDRDSPSKWDGIVQSGGEKQSKSAGRWLAQCNLESTQSLAGVRSGNGDG